MPIILIQFGVIEQGIMVVIKSFSQFIILIFFLIYTDNKSLAHPMPNSIIILVKDYSKVLAQARIPKPDLQLILKGNIIQDEKTLRFYLSQHIRPKNIDGKTWKVEIKKLRFTNANTDLVGEYSELIFDFTMYPPDGNIPENFFFDYDVVSHQLITHQTDIYLSENDFKEDLTKTQFVGKVILDTQLSKIVVPNIHLGKSNVLELIYKKLLSKRMWFLIVLLVLTFVAFRFRGLTFTNQRE